MDAPIGFMGNCVNIANLQIWNRYAILWKKCVIVNLQTWNLVRGSNEAFAVGFRIPVRDSYKER